MSKDDSFEYYSVLFSAIENIKFSTWPWVDKIISKIEMDQN